MKISFLILVTVTLFHLAEAQDSLSKKNPSSLYLGIANDTYYGLYIYAIGYYPLSKKTNGVFYAISRSSQFGTGLNFMFTKIFSVTPICGMINGKSLSGGPDPVIAEGVTPGFLSSYLSKHIYYDQGFIYYQYLRKKGPVANNYIWYWVTVVYLFSKRITGGVHFEQLYLTHRTIGRSSNLYEYLAPYIQTNFAKGCFLRFSPGFNLLGGSFVRVTMVLSFIE
jgi:hypothetical protein